MLLAQYAMCITYVVRQVKQIFLINFNKVHSVSLPDIDGFAQCGRRIARRHSSVVSASEISVRKPEHLRSDIWTALPQELEMFSVVGSRRRSAGSKGILFDD